MWGWGRRFGGVEGEGACGADQPCGTKQPLGKALTWGEVGEVLDEG